jgi:hypothetical protein
MRVKVHVWHRRHSGGHRRKHRGFRHVHGDRVPGIAGPVFEPFAQNFSMLTRNVEENRLQTLTCVNEAVAGARGRMPFFVHPTGAGEHRPLTQGKSEQ